MSAALWALLLGGGSRAGANDHAAEPFVVESLRSVYRFEADGTGLVAKELRVRIQSETGAHQLGQHYYPYLAGRSRVAVEALSVTKKDGRQVEFDPSNARDLPAPVTAAFPMYTDLRVLHVTAPALAPGDVLQYRIVERLEHPEAPGAYWMVHHFEKAAIVQREELELDVPDAPHKLKQPDELAAGVEVAEGRRVFRWSTANVSRDPPEPKGKRRKPPGVADVAFTSWDDWGDVAQWYQGLVGDRDAPDETLQKKAQALVVGLEADRARIEAVYRFVSGEFRYLALAFGIGRYQPHAAREVLDSGYGDCKDKHTLLRTLLSALGYRAEGVLVSALQEELDTELPSPLQFDHIITRVSLGQETIWLDSSAQVAPFDYLPPQLRGKSGLLLGPEPAIVELPEAPTFAMGEEFVVEGEVDRKGLLRATVRYTGRGDSEYTMRAIFLHLPSGDRPAFAQQFVARLGVPGEVKQVEVGNPTALDVPFSLRVEMEAKGFLDVLGKQTTLRPPLLPAGFPVPPEVEGEPEPLKLGPVHSVVSRVDLLLPEGFEAEAPARVDMERAFARYATEYRRDGRRIVAERHVQVKATELAPEFFKELEAFRRTIAADTKQAFRIRIPADVLQAGEGADVEQLERAASQAQGAADHERAAELFGRVVAAKPDHATAWTELGKELCALDRYAEAVEVFRKQLEVDTFHEGVRNWLAYAHEKLDDTGSAEAVYRDQIEQFPLDHEAHSDLGEWLQKAKRCDEAAPLLERAVSLKSTDCDSRWRLARCLFSTERASDGLGQLEQVLDACTGGWTLSEAGRVAKDYEAAELAVALFEKSAGGGYAYANAELGFLYETGRLVAKDLERAVALYRKAADGNDDYGQTNLAAMYESGRGVEKDLGAAAREYRAAAERGYARAQTNLARLYETGLGVEADLAAAVSWYLKAAESGDARAQDRLGEMYEGGRGVVQNFSEAARWYERAALQDQADSQTNLAYLYEAGRGVPRDLAVAVRWYTKAAERGYQYAQAHLANMFDSGRGVEQDFAAALAWYRKAAEQGNARALQGLGDLYDRGRGVPEDAAAALAWYRKAADKGYALAQVSIGYAYEHGRGVEVDLAIAVGWYRRAAEAEYPDAQACLRLAEMLSSGWGVEASRAEAIQWYLKAAKLGSSDAVIALGRMYEGGTLGIEAATSAYVEAAEADEPVAQAHLAWIYHTGQGVERDEAVAIQWLRRAARSGDLALALAEKAPASGDPAQHNREEVVKWFLEVAEAEHPEVQSLVGSMLENGRALGADDTAAYQWFRRSAEKGWARGQYNLGRFLLMGKGAKQDFVASYKWLTLAQADPDVAQDALDLAKEVEKRLSAAEKKRALAGAEGFRLAHAGQQP